MEKTHQGEAEIREKLTVNNTKVTDGAQELHNHNITIQYGGLLPKYFCGYGQGLRFRQRDSKIQ